MTDFTEVLFSTFILNTTNDWGRWIHFQRLTAQQLLVWEYCNPELSASEVKALGDKPVEPTYDDYQSGATNPSDLDAQNLTKYTVHYHLWEHEITRYNTLRKSLARMSAEITYTVAPHYYFLIEDHDDAYGKLVALKRQLAPTATIAGGCK
ncbi:uncharacterized protein BDR25DRAFT_1353 [Lindgomyces ingoldianus]|uniref:Uncharacterized protein n=1 Tax=Lindgomyces ingoldianus TaxID=673940 RepID=A0ACB6REB0_9PLEO|nr:uncharacterized protein BDR25DRAFT_1353 [Lindgomyces ingoldianus]KAF2477476.1 hypothetical protein BDR25DRAFT_1353 [Lindgomyces ingoldianus]